MRAFRSIIFDLGGVLFDINYQHIIDSFRDLGLTQFDSLYTQLKQDHLFDQLETGSISADEFRDRVRNIAGKSLSDDEIDAAWNSILIGFPERNVELLRSLKSRYRIFLLSNTNVIHEYAFKEMLRQQYGRMILDELFERIYLSHHIHMRKPDPEIFLKVVSDNSLDATETLFIDDSPQHVEGALKVGLQAVCLDKGRSITDLMQELTGLKLP